MRKIHKTLYTMILFITVSVSILLMLDYYYNQIENLEENTSHRQYLKDIKILQDSRIVMNINQLIFALKGSKYE